ncbi:MAG: signal peptidase I [Lachnospiraceae bacterium]|nr:signal peptidase I [Lachnospiraceae bacterium]
MKRKMYLVDNRPKFLSVLELFVQAAVIAVLGLFVARYLFYSTETGSRSMEPTVSPGSVVFTDRCIYRLTEPKRFDVVTFRRRERSMESDTLVRRVVGLPGETILIEKGVVYIDGRELDISPYISEITSDGIANESIRLSEDEYFVLGDMPANSEDSRSSTIGKVHRSQIVGKAWLAAKSITEFHLVLK